MIPMGERDLETLRGLSPATKLAVMHGLMRQAIVLKLAWVRSTEPELDDAEAWRKARELVFGGSP